MRTAILQLYSDKCYHTEHLPEDTLRLFLFKSKLLLRPQAQGPVQDTRSQDFIDYRTAISRQNVRLASYVNHPVFTF